MFIIYDLLKNLKTLFTKIFIMLNKIYLWVHSKLSFSNFSNQLTYLGVQITMNRNQIIGNAIGLTLGYAVKGLAYSVVIQATDRQTVFLIKTGVK